MDAIEVVAGGLRLAHAVFLGELRVVMAGAAGLGQIELEHRRISLLHRHHVVRAVAAFAGGGIRRTHLMAHAVDAFFELGGRVLMATHALRRWQLRGMLGFGEGVVTVDAVEFRVHRFGEPLRPYPDPLLGLAFLARLEFRLVAIPALAVWHERDGFLCKNRVTAVPGRHR